MPLKEVKLALANAIELLKERLSNMLSNCALVISFVLNFNIIAHLSISKLFYTMVTTALIKFSVTYTVSTVKALLEMMMLNNNSVSNFVKS